MSPTDSGPGNGAGPSLDQAVQVLDRAVTSARGKAALQVLHEEVAQLGDHGRAAKARAAFEAGHSRRQKQAASATTTTAQRQKAAADLRAKVKKAFGGR